MQRTGEGKKGVGWVGVGWGGPGRLILRLRLKPKLDMLVMTSEVLLVLAVDRTTIMQGNGLSIYISAILVPVTLCRCHIHIRAPFHTGLSNTMCELCCRRL